MNEARLQASHALGVLTRFSRAGSETPLAVSEVHIPLFFLTSKTKFNRASSRA